MPSLIHDEDALRRTFPSGRLPAMPLGYEAQPAWAYSEPTSRIVCQLFRVYGPSAPPAGEGLVEVRRLDRARTHWLVSEPLPDGGTDLRSLSFGEARERLGQRLTFERFCSLSGMVEDFGRLLGLPAPLWREAARSAAQRPLSLAAAGVPASWFIV